MSQASKDYLMPPYSAMLVQEWPQLTFAMENYHQDPLTPYAKIKAIAFGLDNKHRKNLLEKIAGLETKLDMIRRTQGVNAVVTHNLRTKMAKEILLSGTPWPMIVNLHLELTDVLHKAGLLAKPFGVTPRYGDGGLHIGASNDQ